MKYYITLIAFFLFYTLYAQDTTRVKIAKYETYVRTIDSTSIIINLFVDFSNDDLNGFEIDNEKFKDLNNALNPRIVSTKNENVFILEEAEISVFVSRTAIRFEIRHVSKELIGQLIRGSSDFYIKVDNDVLFEAWKDRNESSLKILKVDKAQIEKFTKSKPILTESMAEELIDAKGGELFLTQNKIDFGIIPSGESSSSQTEFNVSFNYRTRYSFLKDDVPIFFSTEGLIGSNSSDSLNYISIYLANYNFFKRTNEFIGNIGIEGNQVFSNYRISANVFWNGIIPNLIDLTFGEDRLRLKPVIKAGMKFYQEIENNRPVERNSNEFSNQIFGEFYYYVPLQSIYSLIIEGTVFYDFNSNANPNNQAMFNYSATLGIDIPKTDFKTIFKYTNGENGIAYQSNDYFMIGLMIDSFEH